MQSDKCLSLNEEIDFVSKRYNIFVGAFVESEFSNVRKKTYRADG